MGNRKLIFCPTCNKEVEGIVKIFNTVICPQCNKILSSDKGIGTVA
jgi:endogenous inhibitor of DNA gyrase (YacG/DUF329 family)